MMKVLTLFGILVLVPMAASAQSYQDNILTQLADQGFHDFEVSRTLLGRVRVTSQSQTLRRELVFNPNTGEILRDYWVALPNSSGRNPHIILTNPSYRDSNDNADAPHVKDDRNGSDDAGNDDEDEREDKSYEDKEDDDHEGDDHEDDDK